MQTYDISLTITPDLPVWPGDPSVVVEQVDFISKGAIANVSRISMGVHTGTHIDAPHHFIDDDPTTVDRLPLNILTGRVYVVEIPDEVGLITAMTLQRAGIPPRTRRLLFKTRNSKLWARGEAAFRQDFVALSAGAAAYLVERGVRLVGVDYLSVAPFDSSTPTHTILLKAGVVIVEGLNLANVSLGRYMLYCLPLKLGGCEGAPARAILVGV
jgi:arylformamidase